MKYYNYVGGSVFLSTRTHSDSASHIPENKTKKEKKKWHDHVLSATYMYNKVVKTIEDTYPYSITRNQQ